MLLRLIPGVCPSRSLLQVLVSSCYLSIWYFCYVVSVPLSCCKTVSFPLHPIVHLFMCFLHRLIGTISCFICIAWPYFGISWVSLLSPKSFDSFLLVVCQSCLPLSFFFSFLVYLFYCAHGYFFFLSTFACNGNFFICPFNLISHPNFVILFGFLWEISILSLISFAPT